MRQTKIMLAVVAAMLVAGCGCVAQSADSSSPSDEQQLAAFAGRVRLALSTASVVAFSPTLADAQAQARRLVYMLEGVPNDSERGIHWESSLLLDWIIARWTGHQKPTTVIGAAMNVRTFLGLAAVAAVAATSDRDVASAQNDLLGVYANLLAAWGQLADGIGMPGLVMILRAFEVPPADS
jgi:hypothetical protein